MFHPSENTNNLFKAIEAEHGVRIVHIANTGSVAWGTNVQNSDADYGFVYVDLPWARKIQNNNRKSLRVKDDLRFLNIEATGYELGYFLSMCLRGNFDSYQILRSDVQIYASPTLRNDLGGIWNSGHATMRHQSVFAATFGRVSCYNEIDILAVENNETDPKHILRDLRFALIAAQCVNYPTMPIDTFPVVLPELHLASLLRLAQGKELFSDIEGIHHKVLGLRNNYDQDVALRCVKAIVKVVETFDKLVGYNIAASKSQQKDDKFFGKANTLLQSVSNAVCRDYHHAPMFDLQSIKCLLEEYHD